VTQNIAVKKNDTVQRISFPSAAFPIRRVNKKRNKRVRKKKKNGMVWKEEISMTNLCVGRIKLLFERLTVMIDR
jgi:hypothetical protein